MKRLILFALIIVSSFTSRAQFVTIPDANFVTFLNSNYPLAMSGNQMDTTQSSVVFANTVNCNNLNIADLYGIQFFDNLLILNCNTNSLVTLPNLPSTLFSLDCNANNITNLPTLPNSLSILQCNSNQLSTLPVLPNSLSQLICAKNLFTSLPSLPNSITNIHCFDNQLTALPTLPNSLEYLFCDSNQLTTIPQLPNTLKELWCINNQIANFTNLPNALETLMCMDNALTSLPPIPATLNRFYCTENPNLNCLPYIPQNHITWFNVRRNTGITCLPKSITATSSADSSLYLPLCTPTSGCPIFYNVTGNVHIDTSLNCFLDSLNNGPMVPNLKLQQYVNGSLAQQAFTNLNGRYSFDANIGDSVSVVLDPIASSYIQTTCPTNGARIAKLTLLDSIFTNQDFGIECNGFDVGTHAIYATFRNSISRPAYILAGDMSRLYNMNCANGISGTVTTTISGPAAYVSPRTNALTPTSVSGNTLTYNVSDFGALSFTSAFGINIMADSNAPLNSQVCIKTIVSSATPDAVPSNDTFTYCGITVNSFDPNDKTAYPLDITAPDEWITYTVRFQNTGNDTAYHIIIRDTLSNLVDESSFTYLNGSVRPVVSLRGNAIMFNYRHINLVDSNTNEPESHGWVQYKVKTKANLPLNSIVENTASIYFDSNPPIVTNTTMNEYTLTNTSTTNIYGKVDFQLFPNPSNGALRIKAAEEGQFKLVNLVGKQVYAKEISQTNRSMDIQLPRLAPGIYIYQFYTPKGNRKSGKLIIK